MTKNRRISLFFFLALFHCLGLHCLYAQSDLYTFPKIEEETNLNKKEEAKPANPFLIQLSKNLDVSLDWLQTNFSRGIGRTDLTRLFLISKKSNQPLENILKDYEKGSSIKKMALSFNLDYPALRKEAASILKKTETELEQTKKTDKAAPSTAGIPN